jgi:hypothetical protein
MPEIKNTFLAGKMNKSIDDRLLPEGEYRDALNVQITKNEGNGSDIGALHNVKSNKLVENAPLGLSSTYEVIGAFFDDKSNTIYYFVTNSSTSHRIYKYTPGAVPVIIVSGSWLKFDKEYPITGVNILENFLFWTDNLNQPRRIDLTKANNSYYDSEEKVSVVKYAPYAPPQINAMNSNPSILSREIEEKFVRFAYRYKFDDNTYSLISPFSAVAFEPKDGDIDNSGNVSLDDEDKIHTTSEFVGMVNGINEVELKIDVPADLNITNIDILYKESDSPAIRILNTKKYADVVSNELTYTYKSELPKSTLPERQLTRVFDNAPVKALAQEIVSNRLIYGNITLGHDIDDNICDYEISYGPKENTTLSRHSIKQRRTYEVGIVFSDKFGRTSPVILSDTSTVHVEAKDSSFDSTNFIGDALKIIFKPVEPGVGIKNAYHPTDNPLGWYSYKIVIKQSEQEYYNVYTSGVLNYIGDYIELINDNINKVPRDSANYNLENDKVASSDVKLYPKVINEYYDFNHGGDYARSLNSNDGLINVNAIALPVDLGLKTDTTNVINQMPNNTDNPLMARLSTKNLGVTANSFYGKLAVFETEPTRSSLDIYYETPTCGLVSEINENIDDVTLTEFSLNNTDSTDKDADFLESSRLNDVVASLYGFDASDNLIDSGVSFGLATTNNEFDLVYNASENIYQITTKTGFAYDSVTPANNSRSFDIVATYAGTSITRTVTLNITNADPTIDFVETSVTMPTDQVEDVNVAIANFNVTDGSLSGATGVQSVTVLSEIHYNADGTVEDANGSEFAVSYTPGAQSGYIYLNDNQHLHNHVTGDYIVLTLQVSDGTNTSTDSITINLTTSGVVGSGDQGATIQYYKAAWSAFDSTTQACAASTQLSVWESIIIFYEGTNEPMDTASPSNLYIDRNLTILAPSGWYKSTAGTVGKWLEGNGSGAWVVGPTSCTQ